MIARKSALIVLINLINGILGYIAVFFIARYMDSPEYALGVVSFAYGFVVIFSIFSNLGFDKAHIKRISEGKDVETCIGVFATIKILLSGLMVFLLITFIIIWKNVFGRGFESSEHEFAIYIMLLYFVLWELTLIFRTTFRARKEIAKSEIPMLFETLGRLGATIFVIINNLGPIALAGTYVIGEIAVLVTSLILFRGYHFRKPNIEYFKLYFKFAFPIAIVVASTKIMTNIDKVLIQLFWNAIEGGNYFAIFRLTRFLDMITVAIGILIFPTISMLHSKKNIEAIKSLVLKSERYLSMILFPIVFLMIFLAEPIIHILLSNKFYPAIPILQIMPLFVLFYALERPYQMKLLGMNLPKITRNRILLMVISNVLLNILLIPKDIQLIGIKLAGLGAVGAAIATTFSYFIGLIYTRIMIKRISNIGINHSIFLHFAAASIMGLFVYLINNYYLINRWYELLTLSLISLGIYLFILYLFREFTKKDFDLLYDSMKPKKMLLYIKNEIKEK